MLKHTNEELRQWQALPLDVKILMTKTRIRGWINEYGEDGVYVSFSGGKDSTVLLDIVRQDHPDIPAVYIDTGLEYPELRKFVKQHENVTWLKPEMNFRVIQTYGYPLISKEISQKVFDCRTTESKGGQSYARKQFQGTYISKNGKSNAYSVTKWEFLTRAPFPISSKCCAVMKKNPAKKYEKETGRVPILAMMAEESVLRKQRWMITGCNAFEKKRPMSNPMAFWTEQDVLQYIRTRNLEIASVYGDIVEENEITGQMTISDYIQAEQPKLKTTGCRRTGCIFCGYGCHREKPGQGKFELLKVTHPKIYDYIMKPWKEGGLNYKEVIDWLNEHGGLHIGY